MKYIVKPSNKKENGYCNCSRLSGLWCSYKYQRPPTMVLGVRG